MRKSVLFFLLPLFLFGGEAQKQLNVFELTPSKMPPQQFKVEAVFSKEIKADCNDAYLIGGKIEQKEGSDGLYYEFSGGDELAQTLMLCDGKKQKKRIYYELGAPFFYTPGEIRILAPKDVKVELKIYELVESKEPKIRKMK